MADIFLPGDIAPSGSSVTVPSIKYGNKENMTTFNRTYIPRCGDYVVGIIKSRFPESYAVNINASSDAVLDAMAFPQATKRNKPTLNVGDLVYCCVVRADKDYELEVSCNLPEDKKGWMTGGNYLGVLTGGITTTVSTSHAMDLQRSDCVLLPAIGEHVAYQVAVGSNGRVWLEAGDLDTMIKLKQAIEASDGKKGVVQASLARALFTAA